MARDPYDWLVHIAPGAAPTADPSGLRWTDITAYVRKRMTITRGKADEESQMQPSHCDLRLNNAGGRFVARNVYAPWYPLLRRGTPLRVRKRHVRDTFTGRTVSSGLGTSTSGQPWTVTVGPASDWSVGSGVATLSISAVNSYRRVMLPVVLRNSEQRFTITPSLALLGASLVWQARFRYIDANNSYGCSVELDRNTGSGLTVTCKIRKMVAGVVTELAVASPVPGLLYTAGQPVHGRAAVYGTRLAVKAWVGTDADEPNTWSLTVEDATFRAAGQVVVDAFLVSTNTNALPYTLTIDNYEVCVDRFSGRLDDLPVTWTPGATDTYVDATTSDLTRRLQQGSTPLRSPLYRAITRTAPIAYWPLEDGANAQQGASGLPSGPPMALQFDAVQFAGGEGPAGSARIAAFSADADGMLYGPVPMDPTATSWRFELVFAYPQTTTDPVFSAMVDLVLTGGPIDSWEIGYYTDSGGLALSWLFRDGISFGEVPTGATGLDDGTPHILRFNAAKSGTSDVFYELSVDNTVLSSGTLTGIGWGTITAVAVNPAGTQGGDIPVPSMGHATVWAPWSSTVDTYRAFLANAGDTAPGRLKRISDEEGVPFTASSTTGERMGPQPIASYLAIARESEATDGGLLYVRADGRFGYTTRLDRYLPATSLSLAYNKLKTFRPTDDDQLIRNDVTASRPSGSSARRQDDDSIAADGTYDTGIEPNPEEDSRLGDLAGQRVLLGTVDDLRYPDVSFELHAHPELTEAWLSTDLGDRVSITSPPAELCVTSIEQIMQGYVEEIDSLEWRVTPNLTPAAAWTDVPVAGAGQRAGSPDSKLGAGGLASGGTSFLLVTTASNGPWTTDPANYPANVRVGWYGGEVVTVSGVTGSTSPQTVNISARAVNGVTRAWPADAPVDVEHPQKAPL